MACGVCRPQPVNVYYHSFFVLFHREVELGGVSRSGVWYMSAPAGLRVLPHVFLLCFTGRESWAEFPEVACGICRPQPVNVYSHRFFLLFHREAELGGVSRSGV